MKHRDCLKTITHIYCPDCGRIKKGSRWMRMKELDRKELDKKILAGHDYKVILDPCGCLLKGNRLCVKR